MIADDREPMKTVGEREFERRLCRRHRGPLRTKSERETLQVRAELVRKVRPRQRELDRRLQEAELVAGVIALAFEGKRVHRPPGAQGPEPARELDLAALVLAGLGENRKEIGREHIAADDREVGWRLGRRRFLDEVGDLVDVVAEEAAGDDAVPMDALWRHALDGDDRPAVSLEHVE